MSRRYPFDMQLGGHQSRSGREEEKILTIPGLEILLLDPSARSESLFLLRYLQYVTLTLVVDIV
jgi:hypothetical protein